MEVWLREAYKKLENMPETGKEIRQRALDDLFFFATLVNPGYMYGDVHKEIYNWLQSYSLYGQEENGVRSNKLIMLPRAHLKSHMVATTTAWLITRHPEVSILYVSATSGLAETQLYAIKNILGSDVYRRYFPEYVNPQEGKREKWSSTTVSIDHPKRQKEAIRDATIETAGLTTNTTGWHADIIVADDLVVPENAYTEDGRESVVKKSSQFTSIRNAGGFTLACGTRYHPNDIYATWRAQEYEVYDDEGLVVDMQKVWDIKEFAVEKDDIFLWPRLIRPADGKAFGFNRQELARIRAEYEDRTQFFAQYYNNPNDPGSNRINREKFQYYDRRHLHQKGGSWYFRDDKLNVYASIDFAYSLKKAADNSVIAVVGINSDGHIFVLDLDVFKTDRISEYFRHVRDMHSRWQFNKLRAEVSVAQIVIVNDLKDELKANGLSLPIEDFRPTRKDGTKEERIASILEHRYDNGIMWHYNEGYIPMLEEQLILARPAHDDLKDALASAVSIAVKPKVMRGRDNNASYKKPTYNSRFGGISFRG